MAPLPAIKPTIRNLFLWLFIAAPLVFLLAVGSVKPPASGLPEPDSLEVNRFQTAQNRANGDLGLLVSAPAVIPDLVTLEIVLPQKIVAPPLLTAAPLGELDIAKSNKYRRSRRQLIKPVKRQYRQFIRQAANRHGVEPAMIQAIIMAESSFNPNAVSSKGAQGLMQLMPSTAESLGVADAFDPGKNIEAGVRYFRQLLNHFQGDIELALAAYNAGIQNVKNHNGVPPFHATQRYVKKVLTYYEHYKRMLTG